MGKRFVTAILLCAVMVLVAAAPLALAETHLIKRNAAPPAGIPWSAVTWEYTPADYGYWTGHVVNDGLRWITINVTDTTGGMLVFVMQQRIKFFEIGAYPTGQVDTAKVEMVKDRHYAITVTPQGPKGASCTVTDVFSSEKAPVARFTYSVDALTVSVDGSASEGTMLTYMWSFGDGGTATGAMATHTYAADGTYTITLAVTDTNGMSSSTSQDVTVAHVPQAPVASFSATMVGMTVSVDAGASSDPNNLALTYAWDFGDLATDSGKTATHTYAVEGTYTITLTVTNSDMLTNMATKEVMAKDVPPVAKMKVVSINYLVVSVADDGSYDSDGSIVSWDWTFGDGGVASGLTATHTYAADGTYTIALTVKDNFGLTASASTDVTVKHQGIPPIAKMKIVSVDYLMVSVADDGSFDPDGSIVSWDWTFGDGGVASGLTATHTYAADGTYMITLKVTDDDGETGSASMDVTVQHKPVPPVAIMKIVSVDYLVVSVADDGSYDPDGSVVSRDWTFGDGGVASGMTATHAYAWDGTYTITLTVKDNDGLTASASMPVTVKHKPVPPVAQMQIVSIDYLVVSVADAGSYAPDGSIVSWDWTFGDGGVASGLTATHTYAADGTYTITLTVKDTNGLTGSASMPVTVKHKPVPPVAQMQIVSIDYLVVSVADAGSYDPDGSIVSSDWTFGDGGVASGLTATHTYAGDGTYTITLTVKDNDGLATSASMDVTVKHKPIPPVADFTAMVTHMDVAVTSTSTDADGTIVSWAWTFSDGGTASGSVATHTYAAPGSYTITLLVTDNDGLTGTASKTVDIVDNKPVASFTFTVNGAAVDFVSTSTDDYGIASYLWDFGDGTTATGPTASHTYGGMQSPSPRVISVGKAPIPPYLISGQVFDTFGNLVGGATVTIVDVTKGLTFVTTADPDYAYYEVDANIVLPGWTAGDLIQVTATSGALSGSNSGIAGVAPNAGNLWLDIVVSPSVSPHDYTVTLTVTDTIGQTTSVSQVVTVYY